MRKVRWYCDFCGLGAQESESARMNEFALTKPSGAAICKCCADNYPYKILRGEALTKWIPVATGSHTWERT